MPQRRTTAGPQKSARRWHIPPPLIHGTEALEGGAVLEEIRGELGLVLWRALRDVTLWAQTPPSGRAGLFSRDTDTSRLAGVLALGLEPKLDEQLRELAKLSAAPESVPTDAAVGIACRSISQWAEEKGNSATALAFAQAAALACPGDQLAALNVGRIAREMADHSRAEVWYRRTIGLARQARDWRAYSYAFIGLGNLYVRRGNFPVGRRLRLRALHGARRGGMRRLQAVALHDLFALEVECGNVEPAERYARQAFDAYGPKSDRLPWLANDLACLWVGRGRFGQALRILQPLARLTMSPQAEKMRIFVLASLARAAAGAGDRLSYWEATAEVKTLAEDRSLLNYWARAFLDLAHGAAILAEWDDAQALAERAFRISSERGENKVRLEAESILGQVARRNVVLPVESTAPLQPAEMDEFTEEFALALSGGAA